MLILSILAIGCLHSERKCNAFRTGMFSFEAIVDGRLTTTRFVRNDSLEIALYKNKQDTATIRWINDCEYILRELHPKNRAKKEAIHIKILHTDTDSYTFSFGLVGASKKQKGIAKKIQ